MKKKKKASPKLLGCGWDAERFLSTQKPLVSEKKQQPTIILTGKTEHKEHVKTDALLTKCL